MPTSLEKPPWFDQYQALLHGAGLVDFSDRTLVEISGEDRASFLHNFCTNDIRKLPAGAGCEAFLTSGHVFVFSGPDSLVLETVPGQGQSIVEHLDRYLIRERVTLADRSGDWGELFLAGARAERLLAGLTSAPLPQQRLASVEAELASPGGVRTWLRRVGITNSTGFLLDCRREDVAALSHALTRAGAVPCGAAALEAARIEAGTPLFGRDISDKNLPQEVARDRLAISFTKGCYLGQETVARLDALGHVNKALSGVRFAGPSVPSPGTELSADGQRAGEVTSASFSPALGAPLALAYVRSGKNAPGTRLDSPVGPAEVVPLPLGGFS